MFPLKETLFVRHNISGNKPSSFSSKDIDGIIEFRLIIALLVSSIGGERFTLLYLTASFVSRFPIL
jgi:hypothetical protein